MQSDPRTASSGQIDLGVSALYLLWDTDYFQEH